MLALAMRGATTGRRLGTRRDSSAFSPALALALGLALTAGACVSEPSGPYLCQAPTNLCDCKDARENGAVVVRWRVSDIQLSRLLPRGQCCCNPDPSPSPESRQQCPMVGADCVESPAWLIRNLQLHARRIDWASDCVITSPCGNSELTTGYCLPPGQYDLWVSADVEVYDATQKQFSCGPRGAVVPSSVRREITAGKLVNLDGIVLGVNQPPVEFTDGGVGRD